MTALLPEFSALETISPWAAEAIFGPGAGAEVAGLASNAPMAGAFVDAAGTGAGAGMAEVGAGVAGAGAGAVAATAAAGAALGVGTGYGLAKAADRMDGGLLDGVFSALGYRSEYGEKRDAFDIAAQLGNDAGGGVLGGGVAALASIPLGLLGAGEYLLSGNGLAQDVGDLVSGPQLNPTAESSIREDLPAPQVAFPSDHTEAPLESPFPGTPYDPGLEWEDKEILAKHGYLDETEERMYGVGKYAGTP